MSNAAAPADTSDTCSATENMLHLQNITIIHYFEYKLSNDNCRPIDNRYNYRPMTMDFLLMLLKYIIFTQIIQITYVVANRCIFDKDCRVYSTDYSIVWLLVVLLDNLFVPFDPK
jgi:hypothetical protein